MSRIVVALALAGALWSGDTRANSTVAMAAADGATYTQRVKIDDV